MVGEEEYEEEWQEEDWYETNEGYWAEDQTWNDGYWANDDLYYKDEYGYFQRKGKGKGKKGKKGKNEEGKGKPVDGKGKSDYAQSQNQQPPAPQQAHFSSSAPSSSAHGFLATVDTEPARVDDLTATSDEGEPYPKRRTRRGGQNLRDAAAQRNREAAEAEAAAQNLRDAAAQRNREAAALEPVHVGERIDCSKAKEFDIAETSSKACWSTTRRQLIFHIWTL
eukprot:s702_g33.t1